jgi:hypothetical protein
VKGELGMAIEAERDRLLIGAYFSQEYAFESAALFTPSIVSIPDQDPDDDSIRFILSLRGVGEGHISSVTFRTGTWDGGDGLRVHPPSPQGVPPRIESDNEGWVRMRNDDSKNISESVIFPILPSQRQGVEDLRLVHFTDDDGTESVIGTYTAFDGSNARAELLRGIDERTYEMRALTGALSGYKGMALFPRRIGGPFAMIGRQDNEKSVAALFGRPLHPGDGRAVHGPRISLGIRADRQLRLTDRNRRRLAAVHPRRRHGARLAWARACSTGIIRPRSSRAPRPRCCFRASNNAAAMSPTLPIAVVHWSTNAACCCLMPSGTNIRHSRWAASTTSLALCIGVERVGHSRGWRGVGFERATPETVAYGQCRFQWTMH